VEQVILAAMDKKRERRPPSARAFHSLLLEAGMQEDDAILDVSSWTFATPSAPPPPIEFGPDEFVAEQAQSLPVGRPSQRPRALRDPPAEDLFPHLPGGFEPDNDGAPRAPGTARAAGHAARGERSRPLAAAAPHPPAPAPRPVPAPPPRLQDLPAFVADAPLPAPASARRPQELGLGGGFVEAPVSAAKLGAKPNAAPLGPRPRRHEQESAPPEGGNPIAPLLRSALGWLLALAALAALAYLANTVFKRPDPRKTRQPNEAAGESAPP
jgi:hypothetical protein